MRILAMHNEWLLIGVICVYVRCSMLAVVKGLRGLSMKMQIKFNFNQCGTVYNVSSRVGIPIV